METSHQPTSRGLPQPIRGLLVNQAPAHKQSDTLDSRESLSQQIDDAYSKAYYQEEQATIWRRRKATFPSRLQEQLSAKTSAEENLPIKELAKAQACQALEDAKELPIPDEHPDRSYNYLTSVRIYKQETASIDKEIKSLELQTEKLFETYQKESAVAQSFTADSQNIEGVGKGSMNSLRKLENDIKSMQLKLDSLQSKKNRLQDPADSPSHRAAVSDYESQVFQKQKAIQHSMHQLEQAEQAFEDCKSRLNSAEVSLSALREEEGCWDEQILQCLNTRDRHLRYAEAAKLDLKNDKKYETQIKLVEEAKASLNDAISEKDSTIAERLKNLEQTPAISDETIDKLHFFTTYREEINSAWRESCSKIDKELHDQWRSKEQPIDHHIHSAENKVQKYEAELTRLKSERGDLERQLSEMRVTDDLLHQFEATGDQVEVKYYKSRASWRSIITAVAVTVPYYFGTESTWLSYSQAKYQDSDDYKELLESQLEQGPNSNWIDKFRSSGETDLSRIEGYWKEYGAENEVMGDFLSHWGDYGSEFWSFAVPFHVSVVVVFVLTAALVYFAMYKKKTTYPRIEFVNRRRALNRVEEIKTIESSLTPKLDRVRKSLSENKEQREAAVDRNRRLAGDFLENHDQPPILPDTSQWDEDMRNLHAALLDRFAKGHAVEIPNFKASMIAPKNPHPNNPHFGKAWTEFEKRLEGLYPKDSSPNPFSASRI